MEISFNNGGANTGLNVRQDTLDASRVSGLDSAATKPSNRPTAESPRHLTITHATATPEELAAAEIPESALTRDDELGNLIGRAFNLPPPPMPAFLA